MPVISVTMGHNQMNKDQKKQLIDTFTRSAAEITRLPHHAFTILITELSPANIGVGGITLEEKLRAS